MVVRGQKWEQELTANWLEEHLGEMNLIGAMFAPPYEFTKNH